MAVGLGGEQLWLSPTVANNVNPFDDQSGQGNNGTAQGGLSTIADSSAGGAYAYDLDGVNDYIDVTSSGVPASAYTVSLWQYSTNSGINTAFNAGQVGGERTVNIDGIKAGLSGDNHGHKRGLTSYWASNPTVRTSATWYHYLLTYDGSELRLYVNGFYVANKTGVPNTDWIEDRCWVGQFIGSSYFFQGRIDDIRTYNRVLTQSEISWLATERGVLGTPPEGLGDEQLWLCPSIQDSANDISGNGNNGTYRGNIHTVVDTAEGGSLAYDLDGSGDYIDCGNGISPTTGYSASAWVNVTTFPSGTNVGTIIEKGYDGTDEPFTFNFRTPTVMRSFTYDGTVHGIASYTHGMSTGVWYHVATTFDGADWKLFVDGTEVDTVSDSAALAQNNLNTYVGASFITSSVQRFLDAKLDDVRLFYRALTQAEITHLATSRGVLGPPGGATHYNPFKSHAFINDFQQRLR